MPVTIVQVEASRPDALAQTGTELGRTAAGLHERIGKQRSAVETLRGGWHGEASAAALARTAPNLAQMQRMHGVMTQLQGTLESGGTQLAQDRTNLLDTADRLRQQGWQVGPDGTVSLRPGSALDVYARTSPVNAMRVQHLAATGTTTVKTLLASFDAADRRLGESIRTAVSALDQSVMASWTGMPPPQAPPPDTRPGVPTGKNTDEVKRWWDTLSDADRRRLIAEQPAELGNLDGIPVAARSEANIAVMNQDIARVENATQAIPYDQMVRYYNAIAVRDGLRVNHDKTGTPTYLYIYEPQAFDGQGRAAVAIGDPDTADNTVVVVPGTSNSVESGWLAGDDAVNVYAETAAADATKSTAVVAWMGYDTPDSMADPQVGQVGLARQGGDLLAADVNALTVTHHGDSHVTVVGHSYGSTTVADAAAGSGMRVDDVVLIGSPGTDLARSAADFHLPDGGNLFVGAASTDPVTHLGGLPQVPVPGTGVVVALGEDPASDGFGSTRFKAEVAGWSDPISDHSSYLELGSEALFSIATIASGKGESLEALGMTAPHRDQIPVTIPGLEVLSLDPETWRPGTSGHTYR